MKNRLARVREIIKREVSSYIERGITFRGGLVTINRVDITPDLKSCHVFVSVLGSEAERVAALETLEHNRPLIQSQLGRRVVMKYTPRLFFKLDNSVEKGSRIISILDELDIPEEEESEVEFDEDWEEQDGRG